VVRLSWPDIAGAIVTIELTLMGSVLALIMAFLAGMGRLSRFFVLRALATAYIEFFRGTSIFVQLSGPISCCPVGLELTRCRPACWRSASCWCLCGGSGARRHPVGRREQYEACTALNLGRWQGMRHVILPQALLVMLPTFGNNAIELLKATSVVSLISLADLTFQAQSCARRRQHADAVHDHSCHLFRAVADHLLGVRTLERRLARGLDGVRV